MAAGDAKAIPVKNVAYRVTFPILDSDGDLVTGAAGLDSEVSIDGGTFADCSSEATEIATASGMYFLDLTAGEMNGDTIAVIVKTSTSGAKTTPIVMYPAARSINDLAYPTVSGRSLDVSVGGEAGVDWANVGSPTTTLGLSGTTVKTATDVETDTQDIQARLPAALVGGRIDANVGAISSDATAADNAEAFFDGTGYAGTGNTIPTVTTVGTLTTYTGNTPQTGDAFARVGAAGAGLTAVPWNAAWDAEVQSEVDDALVARFLDKLVSVSGTSDSGSTSTMVDAARTEGDADYWKGQIILFTSGTIAGQARVITDFVVATDTFTFAPVTTQAVGTQTYVILPHVSAWDDVLAEHLTAGSTGFALNAAGAAGDPWSTALPGAYGAGTAGKIVGDNVNATISSRASQTSLDTLDDFVDTEVAAIKAKTDLIPAAPASTTNITAGTITTVTNLTNAPTAGDLTATMKASVNAEVLDVLNVDTFAEPGQELPPATTTLQKKISYGYKLARNRVTQTATALKVFADDATTVDQKATVSDDGTTYDRGELAAGP